MPQTVIAAAVPESARAAFVARLFGPLHPFVFEPAVFQFASILSEDYTGGRWEFRSLSNGGFFMFPTGRKFRLNCPNGHTGVVGAEAFGVIACLYAYSHLSFEHEVFAEHFHRLRGFALDHAEAPAVLAACD